MSSAEDREDGDGTGALEAALLAAANPSELDASALEHAIAAALGLNVQGDLGDAPALADEPAPNADELRAARRLALALDGWALDGADARLARALHAAWAPAPLANHRVRALTFGALEEVTQPPTAAERRSASQLADALDGSRGTHELLPLVDALACAAGRPSPVRQRRVSPWVVGAAGLVAAAAAVFVFTLGRAPVEPGELRAARSTDELFDQRFEAGQASSRVDRIVGERERDLRHNRFAEWGVK